MKFAGENQLKVIWGTKGFSLNVVLGGSNISVLRGYCKLSAYDQTAFVTFSSILSKVPDGDVIIEQYQNGLDDVAVKVSDGYRLDVHEMDEKQLGTFYEVLTRVVGLIKNS